MGQRGPAPLPSNVHRLMGNRSKKAGAALTDSFSPDVSIPKPPAHLLPEAKKEWRRITPHLEKGRVISEVDRAALAAYCQAYARWVEVEKKIKELGESGLIEKTPNDYKQMSVWLQISNRAVDQMHKFMTEFGMTPSSRSRVTSSAAQSDLFEDDKPAAKFFGR